MMSEKDSRIHPNHQNCFPALNSITFTEDDENELAKLNSLEVINIDDTELGRKRRRNIMDDAVAAFTAAAAQLSNEEQQQLKALLPNHNSS